MNDPLLVSETLLQNLNTAYQATPEDNQRTILFYVTAAHAIILSEWSHGGMFERLISYLMRSKG